MRSAGANPEAPIRTETPLPAPIPTFEVADESEHRVLARWRRNVGAPVSLDLAPPAPPGVRGFDLLSWNVRVGAARLDRLLGRLREGHHGGAGTDPARPLVLLLQEAYRADDTVPAVAPEPGHTGGDLAPAHPEDVVETARRHGLSLRYAPSMRNGAAPSDRGNAVLATAGLGRAHAFALLYVRQRRVAVAAQLAGVLGLDLASAHLDTHRRPFGGDSPRLRPGGARAHQAERLAEAVVRRDAPGGVVLAGDFNTPLGERDPAYRALVGAGLVPARRSWDWKHTHHGIVRLLLDHVLYHPGGGRIASVEVVRLDEHPRDRGPSVYGSDHHPLLARVALAGG
ncbi:MAG TPA: endonuclease/exonuclease/phosphatase family protein [Longimicrobiaceae bacterium]|nr:endonuclease/exonuclease/phosphatase family protein [Longimicrobiaceae bacterium]